jgi:hypothetical protein
MMTQKLCFSRAFRGVKKEKVWLDNYRRRLNLTTSFHNRKLESPHSPQLPALVPIKSFSHLYQIHNLSDLMWHIKALMIHRTGKHFCWCERKCFCHDGALEKEGGGGRGGKRNIHDKYSTVLRDTKHKIVSVLPFASLLALEGWKSSFDKKKISTLMHTDDGIARRW